MNNLWCCLFFKQDSVVLSAPSIEDNIKISTDLASKFVCADADLSPSSHGSNITKTFSLLVIGNKFASTGDYGMAVKYFTDAIKYNPKEFK